MVVAVVVDDGLPPLDRGSGVEQDEQETTNDVEETLVNDVLVATKEDGRGGKSLWDQVKATVGDIEELDKDDKEFMARIEESTQAFGNMYMEPQHDMFAAAVSIGGGEYNNNCLTNDEKERTEITEEEEEEESDDALLDDNVILFQAEKQDDASNAGSPEKEAFSFFPKSCAASAISLPDSTGHSVDDKSEKNKKEDEEEYFSDSSDEESASWEKVPVQKKSNSKIDVNKLVSILDQSKAATVDIGNSKHSSNNDLDGGGDGDDVVFVLGATGAGKSTFIQWVAGSNITRAWDESLGQYTYKVAADDEEPGNKVAAAGVEIGQGFKSKTRHVQAMYHKETSTYFVDSSGFKDTEGIESDIATSIAVQDIASRSKRVRIVICINAHNFLTDRAVELRNHLEVAANFVGHNFDTFKTSFTFLFTHCITAFGIVPSSSSASPPLDEESINKMRDRLQHILAGLRQDVASEDQRLKDLIRFLHGSLKRNYPYCDVFDPQMPWSLTFLEGLVPATAKNCINNPSVDICCNLTPTSRLLLTDAMSRMVDEIESNLSHGPQLAGSTIMNIHDVLTLATHVTDDVCTDKANSVLDAIDKTNETLKNRVRQAVESINSKENISTRQSYERDASLVKDCIEQLELLADIAENSAFASADFKERLSGNRSVSRYISGCLLRERDALNQELSRTAKYLQQGPKSCAWDEDMLVKKLNVAPLVLRVDKLQVYASLLDNEGIKIYDSAVDAVDKHIVQEPTSVSQSSLDQAAGGDFLYSESRTLRRVAFLEQLHSLGFFHRHHTKSDRFQESIQRLTKSRLNTADVLKIMPSLIDSAIENLFRAPREAFEVGQFQEEISSIMTLVAEMQFIISQFRIGADVSLESPAAVAMRRLALEAAYGQKLCNRLMKELVLHGGNLLRECFALLMAVRDALPPPFREKGILDSMIQQLQEDVEVRVHDMCTRVQALVTTVVSDHSDGQESVLKSLLETLETLFWVDETTSSSPKSLSVKQTFEKAQDDCELRSKYLEELFKEAVSGVADYDKGDQSLSEALSLVTKSLKMLNAVESLWGGEHRAGCLLYFRETMSTWCHERSHGVASADLTNKESLKLMDQSLCIISGLLKIDDGVDKELLELEAQIESWLKTSSAQVDETLSADIEFSAKAELLEASTEWSNLPSLTKVLPTTSEMCGFLKSHVIARGERIEECIHSAEELSGHPFLADLEKLQSDSQHIDLYIDGVASLWVCRIQQAIETRRGHADEEFLTLLEADDMDQVKECFLRLKDLDEDANINKRTYAKALSAHLMSRIKSLNAAWSSMLQNDDASVGNINNLVSSIAQANIWVNEHVGRLPAPYPGASSWSLAEDYASFKSFVNESFGEHVQAALYGIENWDMKSAALSSRRALQIESVVMGLSKYLQLKQRGKRMKQLQGSISRLALSTENEVKNFLSLFLANGSSMEATPSSKDTASLHSLSTTLCMHLDEMSKTQALGADSRFGDLYLALRQKLSHGMGEVLDSLECDLQEKRFTRPIAVLQLLHKELLSGSLGEHIDIPLGVSKRLEEASILKQQHYLSMSECECELSRVDEHQERLDFLLKSSSKWSLAWFRNLVGKSSDYEDHRRSTQQFVEKIVNDTKTMVDRSEYYCLGQRLEVIDRIRSVLSGHLTLDRGFALGVVEALAKRCEYLTREIPLSLQRNSLDHFWVLFTSFYNLMSEVSCLQNDGAAESVVCSAKELAGELQKTTHEALLSHCRSRIYLFQVEMKSFNFGSAVQEAKKLRSWGFFMCSLFELYRFNVCPGTMRNQERDVPAESSDRSVNDLVDVLHNEFGGGKVLEIGRSMATLHLASSAWRISTQNVHQAYVRQTAHFQGEKSKEEESKRALVELQRARDLLENESNLNFYQDCDFHFLTTAISTLAENVLRAAEKGVEGGAYALVESLYAKLDEIPALLSVLASSDGLLDPKELRDKIAYMLEKRARGLSFDVHKAWRTENLKNVYHSFAKLERIEGAFKQHHGVLGECHTANVVSELQISLRKMKDSFTSLCGKDHNTANASLGRIVKELIDVGKIMDGFPRLKGDARVMIEETLTCLQEEPWGISFVFNLGLRLEKFEQEDDRDSARIGQVLVSTFPHFDNVRLVAWHHSVIPSPASENLKSFRAERNCRGGSRGRLSFDKDKLEAGVNVYEEHFHSLFNEFITVGPDELVRKVYLMLSEFDTVSAEGWNDRLKKKLVEIVAGVFATFTIIKSGDSFKRLCQKDLEGPAAQHVLFRPHNIQVLSILHLLGIGDGSTKLRNHVMEILTGEGKSVTLGVLGLVLALLGFSVRCVSYSEHLCERDHDLFRPLFSAFAVTERIDYSTIHDMAGEIITAKCDVAGLTKRLLNKTLVESEGVPNHPAESSGSPQSRTPGLSSFAGPRDGPLALNGEDVLLVDEVDVFFGRDFYGKTYNMIAIIESSAIDRLVRRIWSERADGVSFSQVRKWAEYKQVMSQYPEWRYQVDSEIRLMCKAFPENQWRPYEVDALNVRIGYREKDSVTWTTNHGYQTMFAYLKEQEKGVFRGEDADEAIKSWMSLHIRCGHYSYARVSPTRILGVSGTVGSLSQPEREIVRSFGVDTFSYVPSVYGPNNRQFDKCGRGVSIEKESNRYFQALANAAHQATTAGAAALLVFENDERLQEFLETSYGKELQRKQANVLESTLDKSTRQYIINRTATSGQLTLTTAIFGRGTDFFSQDPKLEEAGGLRVIQSFLSLEKSEEVQIMGRTARQGKKGSYQMILLESDLCELLQVSSETLDRLPLDEVYEWLDEKRQVVHQGKLTDLTAKVEAADERHDASVRYANALEQGNKALAKQELDAIYSHRF